MTNIPGKGKGVVAGVAFPRGHYVCEYSGDLMRRAEALEREQMYEKVHEKKMRILILSEQCRQRGGHVLHVLFQARWSSVVVCVLKTKKNTCHLLALIVLMPPVMMDALAA